MYPFFFPLCSLCYTQVHSDVPYSETIACVPTALSARGGMGYRGRRNWKSSADSLELSKVLGCFKHWMDHNIDLHASATARDSAFPCSALPVQSTSFSPSPLPSFVVNIKSYLYLCSEELLFTLIWPSLCGFSRDIRSGWLGSKHKL